MSAHTESCQSCNAQIEGNMIHLGFSDMQALYCSSCPCVLLLKDWTLLEKHGISWPHLQAGDKGWQPWDRHLLPIYQKIEALFIPCSCGGTFRFMNSPRCPKCKGLLRGDVYEDKPILKERDLYAFVSVDSISDTDGLKTFNA